MKQAVSPAICELAAERAEAACRARLTSVFITKYFLSGFTGLSALHYLHIKSVYRFSFICSVVVTRVLPPVTD
jgi:hypothetical protein